MDVLEKVTRFVGGCLWEDVCELCRAADLLGGNVWFRPNTDDILTN